MKKEIKISLYKILRKLGVSREDIVPETKFRTDLFFDETDWNLLLFFLENKFNIDITEEEQMQFQTIGNTIDVLDRHLQHAGA